MRETVLLILVALTVVKTEKVTSREINTSQGPVKGYKSSDGDFFVFYGIPYATEPKGPNKFKAPLPPPMWVKTFEAINNDIICPQDAILTPNKSISDNCLIANIYVPNTEESNLTVIVHIHGGAYQIGYGDATAPIGLADEKKFIIVNFNYRLGVHGFLCLGTEDVPGNAGMKDMVALLRWVKKNIVYFGGNPNNVAIDGCSAGGAAAELLMLTTKDLFNKVIVQSGTTSAAWSVQQNPIKEAKNFAKIFNVTTDDVYVLEEFYKKTNPKDLNIDTFSNNPDTNFKFVPCIERSSREGSFLSDDPINLLKGGKYKKIPMLLGFSNMEGMYRLKKFDQWKEQMNAKFSDFLPVDLKFKSEIEKEAVARTIKEFYFKDNAIGNDTIYEFVDYFSDVLLPLIKSVKLLVEGGNDSIYFFEFSFVDESRLKKIENVPSVKGAGHCEQMYALLNKPVLRELNGNPKEYDNYLKVKSMLREIWTTFVTTGRPVTDGSTKFPHWPLVSANKTVLMNLNVVPELKNYGDSERARFWEGIYAKYRSVPQPPPTPNRFT